MSAHDHRTFVPGCFRCDLSRDELHDLDDVAREFGVDLTASDARPPSDTGATGWHTHSGRAAYRDDQCARHDGHVINPARPVLVVATAEARETVLRAVYNAVARRGAGEDWDTDDYHAVTNDVLAALAGQVQP